MVRDAYANYVVQTTLDVVPESEEKRLFLKELNAHAEELVRTNQFKCRFYADGTAWFVTAHISLFALQRQYTFAKHIVAKLQTMQTT
jgi:hypothetical protein